MRAALALQPDEPLDAGDATQLANAHVLLQLLRCIRLMQGVISHRNYEDIGALFLPVLRQLRPLDEWLPPAAHGASGDPRPRSRRAALAEGECAADEQIAERLGETLCRRAASVGLLCDALESALQQLAEAEYHPMRENVDTLASMLSLEPWERQFLHWAAALALSTVDADLFGFVNSTSRLRAVLVHVLGVAPRAAVKLPSTALLRAGLVSVRGFMGSRQTLGDMLELTSLGRKLLGSAYASEAEMAAAVLRPLPSPPAGERMEWPHLTQQLSVARAVLGAALDAEAQGINLLVHGPAGTGKTAFVQQLVQDLGAQGILVDFRDEEGFEASRGERLENLALCHTFTKGRPRSVLVLDEAEDVFPDPERKVLGRRGSSASLSKAWVNQLLEHNARPVVWISNRVDQIDPAFLRRFALCVHFPPSPFEMRHRLAQERLAPLQASPAAIERAAAAEFMSPALLDGAARLLGLVQRSAASANAAGAPSPDTTLATLMQGHATATGQVAARRQAKAVLPFDTQHLNLAQGLQPQAVLDAARDEEGAALLFHGAPGTGKTQYAAELARQLGRHLVVRTASDINSKWYGESEANVARMFTGCDPQRELLLLDEADVLLGSRGEAGNRADRAVTAEFLRWLECFEGVFICATNHPEHLDPALLRRFVLKVEFLPLRPEQRVDLFMQLAAPEPVGGSELEPSLAEVAQLLGQLDGLTAGDFANVARRLKRRSAGQVEWLEALALEHRSKQARQAGPIGFL